MVIHDRTAVSSCICLTAKSVVSLNTTLSWDFLFHVKINEMLRILKHAFLGY